MVARKACIVYLLFLVTVILFIGNPLKYVDAPILVRVYKTVEPGLHVGLFAILGFLVCASRWRVHPTIQIGVLVMLAAGSELVQFLLPNRTPRIGCFMQDIVGLAIGTAIWYLAVFANVVRHSRRSLAKRYRSTP